MKPTVTNGPPEQQQPSSLHQKNSKSSARKLNVTSGLSRTKTRKAALLEHKAHQTPSPLAGQNDGSASAAAKETSSRKNHGISATTVRCMWEQYDKTETEVVPDVFHKLAEDVTYKLWEVVNTIKVYSRHAGERITTDIVSEVFREANVPPAIGANDSDWERLEYDGVYHFNTAKVLDLRNEYLTEISEQQNGPLDFAHSWFAEKEAFENMMVLFKKLCESLLIENEETFRVALDTICTNTHISCISKMIIGKMIEMLAFSYTPTILERCLRTLSALCITNCVRDADIAGLMLELCQLLVFILLGDPKATQAESTEREPPPSRIKTEPDTPSPIDVSRIKRERSEECEEGNSGVLMADFIKIKQEPISTQNVNDTKKVVTEKVVETELGTQDLSQLSSKMCDNTFVERVCQVFGQLSSKSGFFERTATEMIVNRLEKLFELKKLSVLSSAIMFRGIRALMDMGEMAFRMFFDLLDAYEYKLPVPVHQTTSLNVAALYLNGRKDYGAYKWLMHNCGDSMHPFMLNYYERMTKNWHRVMLARQKTRRPPEKHTFALKTFPKLKVKTVGLALMFPDYKAPVKREHKQIGFRFAGCRPIIVKPKSSGATTVKQSLASSGAFNKAVRIIRFRLSKTSSNKFDFIDIRNMQL